MGDSVEQAQVEETIVNFIAIPLMMIIALYLLACVIAPLINLNTQAFRLIFTAAGGTPILVIYQKSKSNRTPTTKKRT
jgi:hypothetical protein